MHKRNSSELLVKDPMWKTVLNWGVVITFLSMPLVIMSIQLFIIMNPKLVAEPTKYRDHFKYLMDFQRNLAILVFGLTGLRTWEHIKQNGSPKEPSPPLKNVHEPS